jgi:hypothetical protein
MTLVIVHIIIIIRMNVVDNLNSVLVINKPCVCSRTMLLSTFCGLRRDQEQEGCNKNSKANSALTHILPKLFVSSKAFGLKQLRIFSFTTILKGQLTNLEQLADHLLA